MMHKSIPYLLAFFLLLAPAWAAAEDEPVGETYARRALTSDKKNYFSLSVENDSMGGGADQFYTSGVRATWFNVNTQVPLWLDDLADHVPSIDINPSTSTFYSIGQNIYTPSDISNRETDPDDRPWAGFLYGSMGLQTYTNGNHADEFELTLGVVGPEALGEPAQKFVHSHLTDSPTPHGWSNQLEFEPGVILSWARRWPMAVSYQAGDYVLGVEPNINASVGNIYTYAGTGAMLTFGPYQDRLQDVPMRVRPAMPGSGFFEAPSQNWSWFLFAGVDGRAVARNIFLDGNTFKDSPSVDKKLFVGDLTLGAAMTLGDYRLSYSYNVRSPEFDHEEGSSAFGSVTLTARF
jgi:lipid A 3-O-deacylase